MYKVEKDGNLFNVVDQNGACYKAQIKGSKAAAYVKMLNNQLIEEEAKFKALEQK